VYTIDELPAAMVKAYSYGPTAIVERLIEGTEVTVGVIDTGDGPKPYEPVEIIPASGVYDYEARYTPGATTFVYPAHLPDKVKKACVDMAVKVHETLGLRDLSRTDIMVTGEGEPFFIEANVAPGMTETSLLPVAIESAGENMGEVLSRLVQLAINRAYGA
jgi:D-alanine-D-alanine ligase